MGTSSSYGGPGGRPPLLPPWALPQGGTPANPPQQPAPPPQPPPAPDPAPNQEGSPSAPQFPPVAPALPANPTKWQAAKNMMTQAVSGGGRKSAIGSAGRSYVRALGGARSAGRAAIAGRIATIGIGRFLAGVATEGVRETLKNLGLANVVGKPSQETFAAIVNILAPDAASRDQAIARQVVTDTLAFIYEKHIEDDESVADLEAMTPKDIKAAIEFSIASFIFTRWLEELGLRIETNSVSPAEAVRLERDVKQYVRESVSLELKGQDLLKLDWSGPNARQLIDKVFQEAYKFLEEE